jgi:sugar lactone lactonase YvrE
MKMRAALSVTICATLLSACVATSNPGVPVSSIRDTVRPRANAIYKIYVANIGNGTITAYLPDGTQTTPTISTGNYLYAIAVAPSGKIYALTFDPLSGPNSDGTIASYKPDGTKTTPTITIKKRGYHAPLGMAVDASGKIYVLSSAHDGKRGMVTTYKPDGSATTPVFRTGADSSGIAIDGNGKIYVTNDTGPSGKSSVTTYLPDGSATTPTITQRIRQPDAVAIAEDGTIYVANTNNRGPDGTGAGNLTSYTPDGQGPLHAIRDREAPGGIAVTHGKVYLASSNAYTSTLKTYTLDGRRIAPTITTGLYEPSAIAIH